MQVTKNVFLAVQMLTKTTLRLCLRHINNMILHLMKTAEKQTAYAS